MHRYLKKTCRKLQMFAINKKCEHLCEASWAETPKHSGMHALDIC